MAETMSRDGALDRWWVAWQALLLVTLAWPTATAAVAAPSATHASVTVGIAATFALWHWAMALRRPDWEGRLPMLAWLGGILVLTAVLITRDHSYVILSYGLYPQVFALMGRLAVPAAVAVTVLLFAQRGLLDPDDGSLIPVVSSIALAVMLGAFVTTLVRQISARSEALDELDATRAQLAVASHRAGVLEERHRLAREIHDTIAQGFTSIVMQLEAADQAFGSDPGRAQEHLRRARTGAREGLDEVRRAVHSMRPAQLAEASIVEAIRRTTATWSADTGVAATMRAEGPERAIAPEAEVALLRAAQEGLANVAKHAGATKVQVIVAFAPTHVRMEIVDDGRGFDDPDRGDGVGLRGMGERLAELDGNVTVAPAPGGGVQVTATVPA